MGQETQHSERWRAEDVDGGAQAVDRLQKLVGPAARDAFSLVYRLPGDREEMAGGARAADAVGLGAGADLAPEGSVDLHADEAEAARLCAVAGRRRRQL
jgi:hypothetical protein